MITLILTLGLTIIGLLLGWITYYGQSKGSDKRMHYSASLQPVFMKHFGSLEENPRYDTSLHYHEYALIFPRIFLFQFKSTGRSPILPSDFDGPIIIGLGADAQIFFGTVEFARGSTKHWKDKLSVEGGEITIQPSLLNPGDSFTFALLVDGDAQEPEVSVRVAGIDEPVQIKDDERAGARVTVEFNNMNHAQNSSGIGLLDNFFLSHPLLLLPWGRESAGATKSKHLRTMIESREIEDAHEISLVLTDLTHMADPYTDISVTWPETRIYDHWIEIDGQEIPGTGFLEITESSIRLHNLAQLDGSKLHLTFLCSGSGADWHLKNSEHAPSDIAFGRIHAEKYIDMNLISIDTSNTKSNDEIAESVLAGYDILRRASRSVRGRARSWISRLEK